MSESRPEWFLEGLLFENCNCTAVCPGHVHFSQACTHEVCRGFWAIKGTKGEADGISLAGIAVVIVYESPQVMLEGGWRQVILVSDDASSEQVEALEAILTGAWGGPWEVLNRFVTSPMPTRTVPIAIEDEPARKAVTIPGVLRGVVEALRGRDRGNPVVFENIYNQIHAPRQVIARGSTSYDDGELLVRTDATHGLWSSFRWSA